MDAASQGTLGPIRPLLAVPPRSRATRSPAPVLWPDAGCAGTSLQPTIPGPAQSWTAPQRVNTSSEGPVLSIFLMGPGIMGSGRRVEGRRSRSRQRRPASVLEAWPGARQPGDFAAGVPSPAGTIDPGEVAAVGLSDCHLSRLIAVSHNWVASYNAVFGTGYNADVWAADVGPPGGRARSRRPRQGRCPAAVTAGSSRCRAAQPTPPRSRARRQTAPSRGPNPGRRSAASARAA